MPKCLFILDPWSVIRPKKDSSLSLMQVAYQRGFQVLVCRMQDIYLDSKGVSALVETIELAGDCAYKIQSTKNISLNNIDVIWMRKDPPVDSAYLYTTMLLYRVKQKGVAVVNDPISLATLNEKMIATSFSKWTPETLISADIQKLKAFVDEHQEAVAKPLDGMGGRQVFKCERHHVNTQVILETLTQHGQQLALVQRFVPEISQGDKRILVIHGKAFKHALVRKPSQHEFRGNLAAGGKGQVEALSEKEQALCQDLEAFLIDNGILLAGMDVIGGYLTELNITSPTCLREIQDQTEESVAALVWDACERHYLK